jgi:hypothetical protein
MAYESGLPIAQSRQDRRVQIEVSYVTEDPRLQMDDGVIDVAGPDRLESGDDRE